MFRFYKNLLTAFLLFLLPGIQSCKNDRKPVKDKAETKTETRAPYFPVEDFLKSEIRAVDSLPVGILKYTTINGRRDSAYIEITEFHKLAAGFLSPEIKPEQLEKNFSENAFFDHSTQSSVFNYSNNSESGSVRRVDILSKEEAVYSRITSIYLEIAGSATDSFSLKKMMWKPGYHFLINTVLPDGSAEQIKVVWNTWEPEQ